MLIIQNKQMQT